MTANPIPLQTEPSGNLPETQLTGVGGKEAPPAVPLSSCRVAGYEVLGELGRGGMGVVYKARQTRLKRLVALKMILAGSQARRDHLERFKRETEAVARLQHPNIVQIYEVGEQDGSPFCALEFVDGGSLDRRCVGTPQVPRQAAALVATLARAMHAAHQKGIVHRDLKPANVLLQSPLSPHPPRASPPFQGETEPQRNNPSESSATVTETGPGLGEMIPKITDFGLAKQLDDDSGQTRSGAILGTPSYMAPEQAQGRLKDIGPTTDVYALAAILYELLTGRPPFKGATVWDTVAQVIAQEPVPPCQLQPQCPPDLETICLKGLHKEPARRYRSALDLAEDLRRFLAGEPTVARPAGRFERTLKWARRRPAAAALLGVLLLAALAVAAAIPWHIAVLRSEVRAATAEVLQLRQSEEQQREGRRRDRVRADGERWLGEGKAALARKGARNLQEARVLLTAARDRIDTQDALEDPDLGRIRREADRLLDNLARHEQARARASEFFQLRDEAFFQLNRDLFTGTDTASPRASAATSHQALVLFGLQVGSAAVPDLDPYEPEERNRLQTGLYEAALVLAEATARPLSGKADTDAPQRAREALRVLDWAARLSPPTQAARRRRARYLKLAGDRVGAAREQAGAEALRPATALDWFLAGYDRGFGVARPTAADLKQAVSDFDEALDRQPDLFWAQFFRALAWRRLDDQAQARADLTLCIRQRPGFVWSYLLRGFVAGQLGDFRGAEADFARAEKLHPDLSARYVIHVNRGYLALRQKQTDRAVTDLKAAVQLKPTLYHAHVNLAEAYRRRGELALAAAELDEAVRLGPGRASVYRTRARLRVQRRDPEGALSDLAEAVRLEPDRKSPLLARDHLERGLILHRAGRDADAVAECDQALAIGGDLPAVYRLKGEALMQLKRNKEAIVALNRCLEKGKPEAAVLRQHALASAELGDLTAGLDDYTRALALSPDPEVRAARGWAYLVNGAAQLALRDFGEALKADPNNADAHAGRALARAKSGDYRGAAEDAETAVRLGPPTPRLFYNAARAYAQAAAALDADARLPGPRAQEQASTYRERAAGLLREAVEQLPAGERPAFWHKQLERDSAFNSLRQSPTFVRLAAESVRYSP